MDVRRHNAAAWDAEAERGNPWTLPVDAATVAAAARGEWTIVLTPTKPVPRAWLSPLQGARVLCLASGGGQQGPILAAAGARVTVLDNSPVQLARDRSVARRDRLALNLVRGDMARLTMFPNDTFDLVVHPISNCFVPDVRAVWREAYRVLRPGGRLVSGFSNGLVYLFDFDDLDRGILTVAHSLPYSDVEQLSPRELEQRIAACEPLEFGHTLTDQIGGQIDAGFTLRGFYEDTSPGDVLACHAPLFVATLAIKPATAETMPGAGD